MTLTGAVLFCVALAAADAPVHEAEFIFPVNDKHNHGSSIVQAPNGDLIACWFHGSGERQSDDVMVQGSRRRAGSDTWEAPFVMADTPDLPDCNPVLFMDPKGKLWLFWVAIQDNQWGGALLKYRVSTDYTGDGPPIWQWQDVIHTRPRDLEKRFLSLVDLGMEAFSPMLDAAPEIKEEVVKARERAQDKLHQRLGWMTRIHPLMVSEKRMLLGLYSDVFNCSVAAWTEDDGATWTCGTPILDENLLKISNIQPAFAQKKDGTVVSFMRDNGLPKRIRRAESKDLGDTWSAVESMDIWNPGSSVDVVVLKSGAWLLVCNDTTDGRHKLTVYRSEDEGATWPVKRALENEPEKEDGSFSYPSMIQAADGMVHVTYSHTRKGVKGSTIKHARFNEAWLLAGGE
ncbi:MAG TPA: exo-alpha-sialidase [Candidatus Hydrogenedentes bacterium]|nr:exo-alpha-sialidase [Candidatus Hydrogenedentota bacterium]HOH49608.1 exo-alpha-sialidase [Candidatus Hydrogenedentota bacterium]HPA40800.1 exo-alpha-sialidase [Candidatus Hydrogenedentota bacterium]HQL93425.1 exo-alpha-sialidase [Candidatus Hydrogenedentota bacterium]